MCPFILHIIACLDKEIFVPKSLYQKELFKAGNVISLRQRDLNGLELLSLSGTLVSLHSA